MKVLILQHSEGEYDDYHEEIDLVLVVPDDFADGDVARLREEWEKDDSTHETRRRKWSNGAGSGIKERRVATTSFQDWLKARFQPVEWVEEVHEHY
jgi:hypothetical protein